MTFGIGADPADAEGSPPRRIVLGVSGGIAAYKAALLLRLFTEAGHHVDVIPTESALRFVGAPTWEALSGHPVSTEVFTDVPGVRHVSLGQRADLVVVAPATADLLARAANGLADDLLTTTLLATRAPVLMAPAMHTEMWLHPATQANVETLRDRGVHVLHPAEGRLTGTDSGPGRLPEPEHIHVAALSLLENGETSNERPDGLGAEFVQAVAEAVAAEEAHHHSVYADLAGMTVLVSAGGTREPLDPVRYLGNRSSGKQGYALAAAAAARGAEVTLLGCNTSRRLGGALDDPDGVRVIDIASTADLYAAVLEHAPHVEVIIMAAAVADFRPSEVASYKIKKDPDGDDAPVIELVRNPDILADISGTRRRAGQYVIGFAAETGDDVNTVIDLGRAKLARKKCDLLVVNEVGPGKAFGTDDNTVTLLGADGSFAHAGPADKTTISHAILDQMLARIPSR
ncbi:MAG: bifunctional phosphopantothenoylcysteine decarboxylase/phosphopantothenate synthase [Actinomycetales bacterium]